MSHILRLEDARNAGIWIRVSTEMQAETDSPLHHEIRARDCAQKKGWQVIDVYRLEAVSGKSIMAHPETQRMLSDVRSGKISVLIISKFARLVRNTKELLDIADVFRECHADLVSLDEPIDVSSSNGRLFLSVVAALAEWEREEIGARVRASVATRAKLGKRLGGAAPFGYQWLNNQLAVNPEEAPVLKLMFDLYLQHKRKKRVAALLNQAGHRTRNGSLFTDTTVDRLLRNPAAKGSRLANYTYSADNKKAWFRKPESEWVHIPVEPCVSETLWEEVNQILAIQRNKLSRASRGVVYLFSGVTHCECGTPMYCPANYARKKHVCKSCKNRILVDHVESLFLGAIEMLFAPGRITPLMSRAKSEIRTAKLRLSGLGREAGGIRSEMDKCYSAYINGTFDEDDLGRFYQPLRSKLHGNESETASLVNAIDALQYQASSQREVTRSVRKILKEWWPDASFHERRELIENLVRSVVIRRDSVSITFQCLRRLGKQDDFDFAALSLACGAEVTLAKDCQDSIRLIEISKIDERTLGEVMAIA